MASDPTRTVLTAAEVAAIRERVEQATEGPWFTGGPFPGTSVCIEVAPGRGGEYPEPPEWVPVCVLDARIKGEPNPIAVANAEFIAAARTDVPRLLAALATAEADVRRLREALKQRGHMPGCHAIWRTGWNGYSEPVHPPDETRCDCVLAATARPEGEGDG